MSQQLIPGPEFVCCESTCYRLFEKMLNGDCQHHHYVGDAIDATRWQIYHQVDPDDVEKIIQLHQGQNRPIYICNSDWSECFHSKIYLYNNRTPIGSYFMDLLGFDSEYIQSHLHDFHTEPHSIEVYGNAIRMLFILPLPKVEHE